MGGRIETHFQIFGMLAFLAFYRDWKVLGTATVFTALDHLLRGMMWPESVYGVLTPNTLRWLEHSGWVIFEEREESEMLKYVYVSPMGLVTYIAGRSFVRFVLGSISAALMLLVGWFLLGVRWDFALTQPLPLAVTLVAGLAATLAAGYLLSGVAMVLTRSAMTVLEGCMLGLYLLGAVSGLLYAAILHVTSLRTPSAPVMMELPPYRMPTLRAIGFAVWDGAWAFIRRAGTVILGVTAILWVLLNVPGVTPPSDVSQAEAASYRMERSIAGRVGQIGRASCRERVSSPV